MKEFLSDEVRERIAASARSLIGTPYQHQGREPGVSIDCGGVAICTGYLTEGIYMTDVRDRNYSRWPWVGTSFYRAFRERSDEIPVEDIKMGSILMFAFKRKRTPRHCGVVVDEKFMVHTPIQMIKKSGHYRKPRVELSRWNSPFWKKKIYAVFDYRSAEDPTPRHRFKANPLFED